MKFQWFKFAFIITSDAVSVKKILLLRGIVYIILAILINISKPFMLFNLHIYISIEAYIKKCRGELAYAILEKYRDGKRYNINGIYLPTFPKDDYLNIFILYLLYKQTFSAYLYNNDRYNHKYVNKLDKHLIEGVYCYEDDKGVDITIHSGYTVLDLGAWIGDFSAYACKKGAKVYAFEPNKSNQALLLQTAAYNGGGGNKGEIIVVPFGVGARNERLYLSNDRISSTSKLTKDKNQEKDGDFVDVIKLDDWVSRKGVKVDFIKADIEGFEIYMLKGAKKVLKTQQPVLSLCTYHRKNDFYVMKKLILAANPEYRIIKRRAKLFAFVPNKK